MASPTDDSYIVAAGVRAVRMGRGAPGPDVAALAVGAIIGQSNAQNAFGAPSDYPLGDVRSKAFLAGSLLQIGNYKPGATPGLIYPSGYTTGYTQADTRVDGDALVRFANALAAAAGTQIQIYPAAIGGTRIDTWLTGGSSWTTYSSDVAASGLLPRYGIIVQGEGDAGITDPDLYLTRLAAVQAQMVAQSGRAAAAYAFGIVPIGPCLNTWRAEGAFGPIRARHVQAASATGAYLVNGLIDGTLAAGDDVHVDIPSQVRLFRRLAEWVIRWASGRGGELAGPRITGATREGAVITVSIAHAGGTALADGAGGAGAALAGFRVFDGGAAATISSTAIVSATSVRITLAAVPAGVVTLDHAMANLPYGSGTPAAASILYDNVVVPGDTRGIPLQPKAAFTVI